MMVLIIIKGIGSHSDFVDIRDEFDKGIGKFLGFDDSLYLSFEALRHGFQDLSDFLVVSITNSSELKFVHNSLILSYHLDSISGVSPTPIRHKAHHKLVKFIVG